MKSIEELFDIIDHCYVTLIGYSFKDEKLKNEFISNFSYIEIEEVNSSFDFKSFIRDKKINYLLNNNETISKYIVLDTNNIIFDNYINIQMQIFNIVNKIKNSLNLSFPEPNFKLILTSSLHTSVINKEQNFPNNNRVIFMADLAMTINNGIIKIIKNRNGNNGDEIIL